MRAHFVVLSILAVAPGAAAQTYYVRPNGGTYSQCTGTTDADYPGSGSAVACAWNHPFQALPPDGVARIPGGSTLIIAAGSYQMGYGAQGADACETDYPWDCHMPPIPSGPSSTSPTRILGAGWDSGCANPPELWGTERAWYVLNLDGSSNVELACLEITDHSTCIDDHNSEGLSCTSCTVACERDTYPYGDWAETGLYAEDSSNVTLTDLHIHGLAVNGVRAGRLSNWEVERIRVIANGWAGWDGDIDGSDSCTGTLDFRHLEVGWNGCAETYPGETVRKDTCWGQPAGGYGDGLGLGATEGTWLFEDCHVHHNTSDGLDLLYMTGASDVTVTRLLAEGNAGNPLKVSGDVTVDNSVLISNCSYFSDQPLFQGLGDGGNCRAMGNALGVNLHGGSTATVFNTTITGEGDCLMEVVCEDQDCMSTSQAVMLRNTLFAGTTDWYQPLENTCLYYWESADLPADPVDFDHNLVWQVKNNTCPGANSVCGSDPLLVDDTLASFDGHLQASSPAIDEGTATGAPSTDYHELPRDALPDIGAYEYGALFVDGFESGATSRWSNTVP